MTEAEFYERLETRARASLIEWGDEIESCQGFKVDIWGAHMEFIFWVKDHKFPYYGDFPITMATLKEIFCDD